LNIELKIQKILLLCALSLTLASCSTFPEKLFSADSQQSEFNNLNRIDPIPPTLELVKQQKYAEASDYLAYFLEMDYVKDDFDANTLFETIQAKRNDWKYQTSKATDGCLNGKSDESAGIASATFCDALVIGDVRDLWEQGNKYLDSQDIDKMTVILASMGIGATGATVATMGASASTKPAISFLKLSNKLGKTPAWLLSYLQNLSVYPQKTQAIKDFSSFTGDLWSLLQTAGVKSTLDLFARSKNMEDFKSLTKLGTQFGNKTSTLLKLGGDEVIALAQSNKDIPKQLYFDASSFGKEGIKALDTSGSQKFKAFVASEASGRRRMTNFEMTLIASGKRATVMGHEFVKKDALIDSKLIDGVGRSNLERMKMGLAPIGKDNIEINLHHMKQQKDGVIIEMAAMDHRTYSDLLHRYSRVSEIDRDAFAVLRREYWKLRAKDFE
jgi:hypothetical protein